MPDTTPGGLPYPVGTDKVVDGDNAIRALAEALDPRVTDSGWINLPPPINGFIASTGTGTPAYRKIGNAVYLKGVYFRTTAPSADVQATTVPAGARPQVTVAGHTNSFAGGDQPVQIRVTSTGSLWIQNAAARPDGVGYYLTGISYVADA